MKWMRTQRLFMKKTFCSNNNKRGACLPPVSTIAPTPGAGDGPMRWRRRKGASGDFLLNRNRCSLCGPLILLDTLWRFVSWLILLSQMKKGIRMNTCITPGDLAGPVR